MSAIPASRRQRPGRSAPAQPLHVLLVEGFRADRRLVEAFLEQQGCRVDAAATAEQALARFDPQRTDLVLIDLLLPGMDGVEATRRLKALNPQRWVPVILMSGAADEGAIVHGLEAGADDYLVKPIHLGVLEAKLRSFRRIVQLQREASESARMLVLYREQAQAELEIATGLIGTMTQQGSLHDDRLTWAVLPSTRFSGDTVAALRTGSGRLLAMLADATGHGLPAAISLLPALQVFYGMARKDLDVPVIAREMNRRMKEQMPTGLCLAAVLLSVDAGAGSVEVWNGGMPPGLWVGAGGARDDAALASRHLPLGVLDDAGFDPNTACMQAGTGHLVFYSDGLVEAHGLAGEPFGLLRLRNLLVGRTRDAGKRALLHGLLAHLRGHAAHDDISLLMVALD